MDAHHRREALLNWLRSKGTSTASEAADKFNVSTRTILRDVAALRDRGEPIESDAGRGGGLRVDLLRSLPPVRVRLEDVVGLFLWHHFTRMSCGVPVAACADVAVEKLMGILPPSRAGEIRKVLRRVVASPAGRDVRADGRVDARSEPRGGGAGDPGLLAVLERALSLRRGVSFVYTDAADRRASVMVEAQGVLLDGASWWLLGTVAGGSSAARWRLDRVEGAALVDDVRFQHLPLEPYAKKAQEIEIDPAEAIRARA
jgi:predicted DNA-binding transcriptional regulator YafY